MANLAIKGHSTQGKEVINLLEMLGGTNDYFKLDGTIKSYYYYLFDNCIYQTAIPNDDKYFTLEEFEKKFPYKIEDKVTYICDDLLETQEIINMQWDSDHDCVLYYLDDCNVIKVEDILYKIESPEDNIPTIQDKTTIETMKEDKESSIINPILPQDNIFANKGWQCPICGRVYSPTTPMCFYCGKKELKNNI